MPKKTLKTRTKKEVKNVNELFGKLETGAQVLKSEVKRGLKKLEGDVKKLRGQTKPLDRAARKSASDVLSASETLLRTVKQGYERIRRALPA